MAKDHLFEKQIDVSTFNSMKLRIDAHLAEIKMELKEVQVKERYFDKHLKEGVSFLKGIDIVYKNSDAEIKRKIIQTLFSHKLMYKEYYFLTHELEETVKLILFRDG